MSPSVKPTFVPTFPPTLKPTISLYDSKYKLPGFAFVGILAGFIMAIILSYVLFYYIYDVFRPPNRKKVNDAKQNINSTKDMNSHPISFEKNNRSFNNINYANEPGVYVIDLFERSAASHPTQPALLLEDGSAMDYRTLNTLSGKIQQIVFHAIKHSQNRNPDGEAASTTTTPLVSVMIDRNYSFLVAMLGILKAGAAYVPVDPSFPPDRQVYIFNHSRCAFVILDEACYNAAIALGIELPPYIKMDTEGNILDMTVPSLGGTSYSEEEIKRYRSIDSDERLAYVLYTSGSTGKPKGVMVKNVGVVNIINWYCANLRITSSSRVMGLTTFCFDISVLEMWMALSRGGSLVLGKSSSQKDPFTLLEVMKRHRVDVFQATPTTYEMMLATGWTGNPQIDFLVGGEACRPSVLPIALNCRSLRNVCKSMFASMCSPC